MLLSKLYFLLAWLAWLLARPFGWADIGLLWVERKLTVAGTNAKMRAPGVVRP